MNQKSLGKAWAAVLAELKRHSSDSYFSAFLKDTRLTSIKDGLAVVSVKNIFIKAQISARYSDQIKHHLSEQGISVKSIDFVTLAKKSSAKPEGPTKSSSSQKQSLKKDQLSEQRKANLNEKYSFDNFIDGFGTREVFAACQAVADNPGRSGYNPLFIYGGVGLGKTHLIQAAGNAILQLHPNKRVLYITANEFLDDFVNSLRLKSKFVDKYRSYDCLIIDDIQHFSGKTQTQESFFNTFNFLYQNNKQIILSSDRPPSAIKPLTDRLRSRFEQGLIFDIQAPDLETRIAIIKSKTSERKVPFAPELVDYIAKNCNTNVREIEGVVNILCASYELCQTEPSIETAKSIIKGQKSSRITSRLTPAQTIESVSRLFGVPVSEIKGTRRVKDIAEVRQLIMYILYSEGLSYPKIGSEFNKDHTTVLHAVRKIKKLISAGDPRTCDQLEQIKRKLYA